MSELKFNVAQLLREHVGAKRQYDFDEPSLFISDDLTLVPLTGHVKFTRTNDGVLARITAQGEVEQTCGRCLTEFRLPIALDFEEEFYSTVHVTLGTALPKPEEDDAFLIDENHMLDVGVAIGEYTLLELPIAPVCREECLGFCPHCGTNRNETPCDCVEETTDERLSVLRQLLEGQQNEPN